MTTDEIMYKAFLIVWKVLRQNQPKYYMVVEKILRLYKNGELTEEQLEKISPEWINMAIETQKERNLERFIRAIMATSDDRWKKAKLLNQGKIDQLKRKQRN